MGCGVHDVEALEQQLLSPSSSPAVTKPGGKACCLTVILFFPFAATLNAFCKDNLSFFCLSNTPSPHLWQKLHVAPFLQPAFFQFQAHGRQLPASCSAEPTDHGEPRAPAPCWEAASSSSLAGWLAEPELLGEPSWPALPASAAGPGAVPARGGQPASALGDGGSDADRWCGGYRASSSSTDARRMETNVFFEGRATWAPDRRQSTRCAKESEWKKARTSCSREGRLTAAMSSGVGLR